MIDVSNKKAEEKKERSVIKPMKSKEKVIEELKKLYKPNTNIGKKLKRKFDQSMDGKRRKIILEEWR